MEMKCSNCGQVMTKNYCDCIMPKTKVEIPMPKVKEPNKSVGGITIQVNSTGLDESLEKARELIGVLQKIDGLTGRITRDIDKMNRYTLGKQI